MYFSKVQIYDISDQFLDSSVPILLCLMLEKGLSTEIIPEMTGRLAQTANLTSMILIPIVVIHVRGASFSMSKFFMICSFHSRI